MAVLGTGSWTLSSGPRVVRSNKLKTSISRWTLVSGTYQNGIKLPPIGAFGMKRNLEMVEVIATATSVTQGILWSFDRANRKLRGGGMGSSSLATAAAGRKRFVELTSRYQSASASGVKAAVLHLHARGW